MQNILLKVSIVLGTDWAWPSRSNFTLLKNYIYLHRFCIFEIFVRHVCRTVPHPTWLRTHSLTPTCPPTGSRHRLWNCLAVYLGETIGISSSLDSAIGTPFYKLLSGFVRRVGLLWSQQDFEWRWSVPLFKCLTVLEFSFILFDLCLLITFFNFIMNYVPIVTFWIFTYHKIWILSIMFCFIWSYWIIYFLACLEVSWRVVS